MFKKKSLPFIGFLQATGLALYIILIACFFNFVIPNFNSNEDIAKFFAPLIMLMLFIVSAMISATIALGRAGVLFWEKYYKESFQLIFWTVTWGVFYIVLFISYLLFLK